MGVVYYKTQSRKGVFLGYMPGTTQNIIWLDDETKRIKYATHARFDEGMNDVPINKIPPNVQLLQRSEYGKRPAKDQEETNSNDWLHQINKTISLLASTGSCSAAPP